MAFTGTPVMKLVADNLVRITGLALAGGASGTISLSGGAGQVLLSHAFQPKEYKNAEGADVSLPDSIEVTLLPGQSITTLVPIMCVKSGSNPTDFLITLTNTTVGTLSAQQEIYIRHH